MKKTKSLRTQNVLRLFLWATFLASGLGHAKKNSTDQSRIWIDALDFLKTEGNVELRALWFDRLLEYKFDDPFVYSQYIETVTAYKERPLLIESMQKISTHWQCLEKGKTHSVCLYFKRVWGGHLDSLLFFEDSPGKIVSLIRKLDKGECSNQLGIFEEIHQKEGDVRSVLEIGVRLYACLGQSETANRFAVALKKLEMF